MKTTCREIAELLSDYDDPGCETADREIVTRHLAECADCRQALDRQRSLVDSLRREVAALTPTGTPFQVPGTRPEGSPRPASSARAPGSPGNGTPAVAPSRGTSPAAAEPGWFEALVAGLAGRRWALAPAALALLVIGVWLAGRPHPAGGPGRPVQVAVSGLHLARGTLVPVDGPGAGPAGIQPAFGHRYRCQEEAVASMGAGILAFAPGAVFVPAADRLTLEAGQVHCRILPQGTGFAVETPCAVVTVVGTDFTVVASPTATTIHLHEGRLRVSGNEDPREMTASESRTFFPHGPSRPWAGPGEVPPPHGPATAPLVPGREPDHPPSAASTTRPVPASAAVDAPLAPATPSITSPEDTLLGD